MTKSTITREQATDKEIQMLIDSHENGTAMFMRTDAYYFMAKELQERRKAERASEPVAYTDERNLGYIDRGRETAYLWGKQNTEVGDVPLYRHAQQPVVPDESYKQLSELYHTQEKRLFKIAQRIKGPTFDKYSHLSSQAIDVLEAAIFGEDDTCRAAMLQAGNSPVNDVTNGKPLTIILPDITSKAFWSCTGKTEIFHPETYCRWVKEAIERYCAIARIDVEVK